MWSEILAYIVYRSMQRKDVGCLSWIDYDGQNGFQLPRREDLSLFLELEDLMVSISGCRSIMVQKRVQIIETFVH